MSGRGTASGVSFQCEVGAYAAALMLAERPLSSLALALPGIPVKVSFETQEPVDDILIQSDKGHVFIQAKSSISLSSKEDGELASVADQFIRQFRAGVIENGALRALDPLNDRLVLAVSEDAPATIKNDLRNALERSRTAAATLVPKSLTDALDVFSTVIEGAWIKVIGATISAEDKAAILSVCYVVVVGDSQRQLAETALRDIVANKGDESSLIDFLRTWATDCSENGTGGDEYAIRLALQDKISLKEPPRFIADVANVNIYSAKILAKLNRFTELAAPEGTITISRPVTNLIVAAARAGSLAITGEPGAGKSAVICQVAQELMKEAPVVVLTVEANSISLDALRAEMKLQYLLSDVMQQLPGGRPAYLILDALDAVRGGVAEATYKQLVEDTLQIPGWHVIASVRSFDLRQGRDWKRIFMGTPPLAGYIDKGFGNVRHVHIGLLEAGERAEVALQSPSLATAISAGGQKMEALASNPFNLALLGDLLSGGVAADSLATIATRGELLERYWEQRIQEHGTAATVSLMRIVTLMVDARSIDLAETKIPLEAAPTVDTLQRVGVLITESTRRIGFRHHVLFDYAVARLLLVPDLAEALGHLKKGTGAGLLISPSLGYWLENVKKGLPSEKFWHLVVSLVGDDTVDPIIRVEAARIAVELVQTGEDLSPLAAIIAMDELFATRAFMHLVGSITTRTSSSSSIELEAWAYFLEKFATPNQKILGSIRILIGELLEKDLSPEASASLGVSSRALFDAMSENDNLIAWLSPTVIPFIAKTYKSNPAASRQRLSRIFETERFERLGYIEVPWLARELLAFANDDPDFVVEIFYRVFLGGNFSAGQATYMSRSYILGLTSNAAQDFDGAKHALGEDFPKILEASPETGVRAFAAAIQGERDHDHANRVGELKQIPLGDAMAGFEEDGSWTWAWDIDSTYDDYAKLYQAFLSWVTTARTALLENVIILALQESQTALVWRTLFDAAAKRPEAIGRALFQSAASSPVLYALDTRSSAVNAIAAVYSFLSQEEKEQAESKWLERNLSAFAGSEDIWHRSICIVFETIGEANLATVEAREFLQTAKQSGKTFENSKPLDITTRVSAVDHWLVEEDVDVGSTENAPLLALAKRVSDALAASQADPQLVGEYDLWDAVKALSQAMDDTERTTHPSVELEATSTFAKGLGMALSANRVPEAERLTALENLLKLSHHSSPQVGPETEVRFADFATWSSLAVRVDVAQALANLLPSQFYWPLIRERVKAILLDDPHPAVRLQLATKVTRIWHLDEQAAWELAEQFASRETNPSIIQFGVHALSGFCDVDPARVEQLITTICSRVPPIANRDDKVTGVVISLAIEHGLGQSYKLLEGWVENYYAEQDRVQSVLFNLREALVAGFQEPDPSKLELRKRARDLVWQLVSKIEPAIRTISADQPVSQEQQSAIKLTDDIARQLYYAAGHDAFVVGLDGQEAKGHFLTEYAPLISKLATLGTPGGVYQLLQLVKKFVEVDPELCFDLISEAMLRTTGVAKYEHEHMGAKLFVELVTLYLADYRSVFTDTSRRDKLVDCIAVFVEAGWPEARKLFQSLPELLQ